MRGALRGEVRGGNPSGAMSRLDARKDLALRERDPMINQARGWPAAEWRRSPRWIARWRDRQAWIHAQEKEAQRRLRLMLNIFEDWESVKLGDGGGMLGAHRE